MLSCGRTAYNGRVTVWKDGTNQGYDGWDDDVVMGSPVAALLVRNGNMEGHAGVEGRDHTEWGNADAARGPDEADDVDDADGQGGAGRDAGNGRDGREIARDGDSAGGGGSEEERAWRGMMGEYVWRRGGGR